MVDRSDSTVIIDQHLEKLLILTSTIVTSHILFCNEADTFFPWRKTLTQENLISKNVLQMELTIHSPVSSMNGVLCMTL